MTREQMLNRIHMATVAGVVDERELSHMVNAIESVGPDGPTHDEVLLIYNTLLGGTE